MGNTKARFSKSTSKIKTHKIKVCTKKKEIHKEIHYNKWYEIDSLLCVKKDPEFIKEAKKRMLSIQLVVYGIHADFNFIPTENEKISTTTKMNKIP